MSDRTRWQGMSAWAGLVDHELSDAMGRDIELLDTGALATIIVGHAQEVELARRLRENFGCGVPTAGKVEFGEAAHLVWSAPGQWLSVAPDQQALADLPAMLAGVAAVTDQSDSRAIIRINGPRARDILGKGFAIDLHPSAFSTGSSAVTKVAHLSVQIWQVDERPTFMIAVPRSFAGSFLSWVKSACAPLGESATPGATRSL